MIVLVTSMANKNILFYLFNLLIVILLPGEAEQKEPAQDVEDQDVS